MRTIVFVAALAVSSSALAQPAPTERQRQGAAALLAGKLEEAEALYQQALAEPTPDAPVWFDLCLVRYAAGDFGGAINACYRALPADEHRVLLLLQEIALAMQAAKIRPGSAVVVPEPTRAWFFPHNWLFKAMRFAEPPAEAGAVRVAAPLPSRGIGVDDVLQTGDLEGLRGTRPVMPYRFKAPPSDYGLGVDVAPRVGVLFYAPDASPFLVGARVAMIQRPPGSYGRALYFGEYLHAPDGTGGLIAGGAAGVTGWYAVSTGFAIPWGRSEGRSGTFRNHVTGLHGQVRVGAHKELLLGRSWAISFEASILGGLDFGQLAALFGHGLKDFCLELDDQDECPETPERYPNWPLGHWGFQAGISIGQRSGHPPYPRAHVFGPMGGS